MSNEEANEGRSIQLREEEGGFDQSKTSQKKRDHLQRKECRMKKVVWRKSE